MKNWLYVPSPAALVFVALEVIGTPTVTTAIMMVEMALISGVMPSLTALQTRTRSVAAPGPVVKLAMSRGVSAED